MNTTKSVLDMENIKKIAPISFVIGLVLGFVGYSTGFLGGLWGIILIIAWAFCGILYSNVILKAGGASDTSNLAANGAILAIISELAYTISIWIINSFFGSPISIWLLVEAGIIGALSAVFWHSIQTANKK